MTPEFSFIFDKIIDLTVLRVTTCLENLEMSGNLTAAREMSGILLKVREKLPKTVCCMLHIRVHTGI